MNGKILKVNFDFTTNTTSKDEFLLEMEEILINYQNIEFEIIDNENNVELQILKNKGQVISLKDFSIEGKVLKELGIRYNIFTIDNYIKNFKIDNIIINTNNKSEDLKPSDLDKHIYKVPENDQKVLDVLNQLKEKRK